MTVDPLLNRINSKLESILPPGMHNFRDELASNLKVLVQEHLSRLDLVNREEFDIQKAVLEKANKKLKALELRVTELETRSKAQ